MEVGGVEVGKFFGKDPYCMANRVSFFSSSIGLKVLMAVTGVGLVLFLVAHLLGNLQLFLGQAAFNDYAAFLKSIPGPLWAARIGLIVFFVLHIVTAIKLSRQNSASRPQEYAYQNTVQASVASRTMLKSGMLILAFVVYHLLHFTLGAAHSEYFHLTDSLGRHDVYSMVVRSFQQPEISAAYILLLLFVGFHLSHAIPSFFRTLGFYHPAYTHMIDRGGRALSALIALGYISIPVSVLAGIIQLP